MNGDSEHLNNCSQGVPVELQTGQNGKSMRLPSRSTKFPPLPRRHGMWIDPQAFLGVSCFLLSPFQHGIPRRILPIPRAPAVTLWALIGSNY